MKSTIQKLQITNQDYDFVILNAYTKWCMNLTTSTLLLQNLLNNQKLFNWFQLEMQKIETEFHKMTDRYENLSKSDYGAAFEKCLETIYNYYPSAIVKEIQKQHISYSIGVFGQKVKSQTILPN